MEKTIWDGIWVISFYKSFSKLKNRCTQCNISGTYFQSQQTMLAYIQRQGANQ